MINPPDTSRLTTEVCRNLNMARRLQDMASRLQEGGSLEKGMRELAGRTIARQAHIHSCQECSPRQNPHFTPVRI